MRLALASLAFVAAVAVAGSAGAKPHRYASCDAAPRDKPTLDRRVLPGARFEMVEQKVGWERGMPLYRRHGRERVHLGRNVLLTVDLGGCETHTNVYEFRLARTEGGRRYWLRRGAQLIGRIERANRDPTVDLAGLRAALLKEAAESPDGRFPDGGVEGVLDSDGFGTTYEITLRRGQTTTYLTIAYRIAL